MGVIFHCRIENLFYLTVEPVDLIYKEYIVLLKTVEYRSHFPGLFNGRSRGDFHMHAHLVGNDACKSRFTEPWRSVEQYMIQGFSSCFGCFNINRQCLLGLLLSDVIFQMLGAQFSLYFKIFLKIFCCL